MRAQHGPPGRWCSREEAGAAPNPFSGPFAGYFCRNGRVPASCVAPPDCLFTRLLQRQEAASVEGRGRDVLVFPACWKRDQEPRRSFLPRGRTPTLAEAVAICID